MNKLICSVSLWTIIVCGICCSIQALDDTDADSSQEMSEEGIAAVEIDPASAKYQSLEQQIENFKGDNKVLESKAKQIESENSQIRERVRGKTVQVIFLSGVQVFLNPLRFFSPLLANLIYIFGAISFLIMLVGWPVVAKKVLSQNYVLGLPKFSNGKDVTSPMSTSAKTIWVIIAAVILLFLALPAFSQDLEGETETSEAISQEGGSAADAEKEEAPTPTPTPSMSEVVAGEMVQAIGFINLSSLDRAILVLDSAGDDETVRLILEPELLKVLIQSAQNNNHPCIIATEDPPTRSIKDEFRKDTMGYLFMKATLYEAAGKEGVKELIEKGAAPMIENEGATLDQLPMEALSVIMQFLGAYKSDAYVKVMIPFAIKKAKQLNEIRMILELAHALDLQESYQKALDMVFERKQEYGIVESLFNLAVQHGRNEAALSILAKAFKPAAYGLEDNLNTVLLMNQIGSKDKVRECLNVLADVGGIQDNLKIAMTASDLELGDLAEKLLLKALDRAGQASDFLRILDAADKCKLNSAMIKSIADKVRSDEQDVHYQVQVKGWPNGFGAAFYDVPEVDGRDNPEISLGVWVAIQLYLHEKTSVLVNELFELAIHRQLEHIIESLGSAPLLNLNDLYALVQYYSETENNGLETAMKMLAVQRHLRGLSDKKAEGFEKEDARLLALQMELEQQEKQNQALRGNLDSLAENNKLLVKEAMEINGQFFLLLAEIAAKILLVCIALWIALLRAIAAARTARNYRFSQFCLTFTETIGFQCCCTIILIVPGLVLTLVSQDRLKHHHIVDNTAQDIQTTDTRN